MMSSYTARTSGEASSYAMSPQIAIPEWYSSASQRSAEVEARHRHVRIAHGSVRDIVVIDRVLHQRDPAVCRWNRGAVDAQLAFGVRYDLLAPVAVQIHHMLHR